MRANGILKPGPRTGGKEHGELSSRMGRIRSKAQEQEKTASIVCRKGLAGLPLCLVKEFRHVLLVTRALCSEECLARPLQADHKTTSEMHTGGEMEGSHPSLKRPDGKK